MKCFQCHKQNPAEHLFCGRCGGPLMVGESFPKMPLNGHCERKTITVVFTDLVGYTAMSEALDPEDVQEIMGQVFNEIKSVVAVYKGYIDKLIGDAAMILFGVPVSHEDDPVRATRAAYEIHRRVAALRYHVTDRPEQSLTMHTGINTGLVVIDKIHSIHETQGFTGDAINLAARLAGIAGAGEILVGANTYALAKGFFHFAPLRPARVKGKSEPVAVYKVVSPRISPLKNSERMDVKAKMIGRSNELARLLSATDRLIDGHGAVITVCGEAGTGKSRLVAEFKNALSPQRICWLTGHAFTYCQHMPYAVVLDFFIHWAKIEEGDSPRVIRRKIGAVLSALDIQHDTMTPYVEKLFALSETALNISPEIWKAQFESAFEKIVQGLSKKRPTVICLEDIHWADPSSLALIRSLLSHYSDPLLFLCVHRPEMTLIDHQLRAALKDNLIELQLRPLTAVETQDMLKSLLKMTDIPVELNRFIESKAEGNPFYLEEVVLSLIESKVLVHDANRWRFNRSVAEARVPLTIEGIISGRLDRLNFEHKLILREASVIGRSFIYDILVHITRYDHRIDECLDRLLFHGLIKMQTGGSDLAYIFKHALTQEVVYKGLLKKERREVHERIGVMIEQVYPDRLPEFFETLAYHFKRGRSVHKAIAYLAKSGEKSLKRYALEEAHRFYQEAFDLSKCQPRRTSTENKQMLDLLNGWSFVYYYRGRYEALLKLLEAHKALANSLTDKKRRGLFYAWLGCALWHRERCKEAHGYLQTALDLGQESNDAMTLGYARCWLTWVCTELGMIPAAVAHAQKAQCLFETNRIDPYIFINSLAGMGYAFWHSGNLRKTRAVGQKLVQYGVSQSDSRSKVMGYCCLGWSQLIEGDLDEATSLFKKAVQQSLDPWYSVFPKLALCYGYISFGKIEQAERLIQEIDDFSTKRGAELVGNPAHFFRGVLYITRGHVSKGMRILKQQLHRWKKTGNQLRYVSCGQIYASICARLARRVLSIDFLKPIYGFALLIKGAPFSFASASRLFETYIEAALEIDAKGLLGKAYLDWGLLHQARGRMQQAEHCYLASLAFFRQCQAEGSVTKAQKALESLRTRYDEI